VDRVVVVGTGAKSSAEALELTVRSAARSRSTRPSVFTPTTQRTTSPRSPNSARRPPRLVGIGECGLDYFYEHSPRAQQRQAFSAQIALAFELDLALVVHARDAFDDLFRDLFASEGVPPRTVIHCFTGTPEDAEECLERGCDISISGIVTFKNAEALREAARLVPLDRLHVETDSPVFGARVPIAGEKKRADSYVAPRRIDRASGGGSQSTSARGRCE
jgi:TatD family hydrolase